MDSISEREVLSYIKSQKLTLVLISHKIDVVADSNCIYVLQKGSIIAHGTNKELKQHCELYRQLCGREA